MERENIRISDYDYALPKERIAGFPLPERDLSKLLIYRSGEISHDVFRNVGRLLPDGTVLIVNNTRVVRARLIMRNSTGARIEIFCLEPHEPADYERAFAARGYCEWKCMVGNAKRWKEGTLETGFSHEDRIYTFKAARVSGGDGTVVCFEWDAPLALGQVMEILGRMPIPPYLCRESEELDNVRYQTVYSQWEGSVAAPTAGLHFSERLLRELDGMGFARTEVTLHVGAGTFLPVKSETAALHRMHTEHFEVGLHTLDMLASAQRPPVASVGTTTVRTLESLPALGYRVLCGGDPRLDTPVGQWEPYGIPDTLTATELIASLAGYLRERGESKLSASTQIMIMPGFRFGVTDIILTNLHQPRSTLLLLVSAFVGGDWRRIYDYALSNDFRFLSYGDSSILFSGRRP